MKILLLLGVLGAARPAAPAPAPRAARTLAIFPLTPLGTEAQIADQLEGLVYAELQSISSLIVVPRAEAQAVDLAMTARGSRCAGTPECLSAFGRALGADQIFYATVAGLGDSHVLDAKLIDAVKQQVLARQSVVLQGEQAVLIRGVRELSVQVVAPELYVGTLDLRVNQDGAEVIVDGAVAGRTPLAPLRALSPGKHALRLRHPAHAEFDHFVDIRYGETTRLDVDLATGARHLGGTAARATSAPAPAGEGLDLRLPLGIGGLAAGGLALGVGLISGAQLLVPWLAAASHTRALADGQTVVTDREAYLAEVERYRQAQGWWWLGVGLTSTAAVLLPAGAALLGWQLLDSESGEALP